MNIDGIGYFLKRNVPFVYSGMERVIGGLTYQTNRQTIEAALKSAEIQGSVGGFAAVVRPLKMEDLDKLVEFIARIPESHLQFFKPHGFDRKSLHSVLKKRYFLIYGLIINDEIVGYGILKLFIGKKTFRGRLVSPDWSGHGIGKYLSRYLSWQVGLLGFKARSTISRKNLPSLKSHEIEGNFRIIEELPNDYMLIEFKSLGCSELPELRINQKSM